MLHDMFDLLGLPLYNTGLAIFDIWSDESKENQNDIEEIDETILKSKHVLSVANRWRRKHRRMSASNSRSNSAVRAKSRTRSAKNQCKNT